MKTTFTFFLLVCFTCSTLLLPAQTCSINQDQVDLDNFAIINTKIASGQTFKACQSGEITQIRVNFIGLSPGQFRLQLAPGLNTLEPAYTQDFEVNSEGDINIELSTPFPVEDQQNYAFTILGVTGNGETAQSEFGADPYPDGNSISEGGEFVSNFDYDTDFSLTITDGICEIEQDQTGALINISSEVAAGQTFKACGSGEITQIRVNLIDVSINQFQLRIAEGLNTLSPDYTQDFVVNGDGDITIELSTPFVVKDQQNYAFTIIGLFGVGTIASMLTTANTNLYLDGDAINELNGNFNICICDADFSVTIMEFPVPANDLPCNAISLPVDGTVQTGFTNINATSSDGEEAIAPAPDDCTFSWCIDELFNSNIQVHNSVWFNFVAPTSGAVEISTCNLASFDTQIALYDASDCNDFSSYTLVAANDDGPSSVCPSFSSMLQANNLVSGQTYYVMVDGFEGAFGQLGISITETIATSTEETVLETLQINVFPNPNNGQFGLQLEDLNTASEMMITNLSGQLVYRQSIASHETYVEIDLKEMPKGLYFLSLVNEQQKQIRKVMIE